MHVCACTYTRVHLCVRACVDVHSCVHVCAHACVPMYTCVCMCVCVHAFVCMHVCLCVSICANVYVLVHLCMHVSRYDNEQPFRKAVEEEISSLYKVMEDARETQADLEQQMENMRAENHEEVRP